MSMAGQCERIVVNHFNNKTIFTFFYDSKTFNLMILVRHSIQVRVELKIIKYVW